jgi:sirohydrochlorin cobaltochelatase
MASALVLFAHGSRDPEWAAPFRRVQQRVAAADPKVAVELAFLELMQPSLIEAIDNLVSEGRLHITVAPLFMAQGAHLKRDLKKLITDIQSRHPSVEIALLPAAGEVDEVIDAIGEWLCASVASL